MEITVGIDDENRNSLNEEQGLLLLRPFAAIGRRVIAWVGSMGAATIFLSLALIRIPGRNQLSRIIQQTYYIGARSITIIMLVSLFTGMVLGLQSYHALVQFGAAGAVGEAHRLAGVQRDVALGSQVEAEIVAVGRGRHRALVLGASRPRHGEDCYEKDDEETSRVH